MKDEPTTGSPPMPAMVELPSPSCVQLVTDLVGERAGATRRGRFPSLEISAGMIPTLALPGDSAARAVRPEHGHVA